MEQFLERDWIFPPSQYLRESKIPQANNFKAGLKGRHVTTVAGITGASL